MVDPRDPKRILRKLELEYTYDFIGMDPPIRMFIYPLHTIYTTDEYGGDVKLEICLTLNQDYVARFSGPTVTGTHCVRYTGQDWETFFADVLPEMYQEALGSWLPYTAVMSLYIAFTEAKQILQIVGELYESGKTVIHA